MSEIPLVDIEPFVTSGKLSSEARSALDTACRDHGFFLLTGHGMDESIQRVWEVTLSFFGSPRALKRSVSRSRGNALGYFDRELTKQKRDQKEVFDYTRDRQDNTGTGFGESQWPESLPGFRPALLQYFDCCASLTNQILAMLYTALGLSPSDVPTPIGAEHTAFARLNHYPVEDPVDLRERDGVTPLGDMALHHHTDPGVITLLLQDEVGGLQTLSRDGGWMDVPPYPGAIVVNMSDMVQVLTNDQYRASTHRVLPVPGRDRYSIVYFSMPRHDARIEPSARLRHDAARYRPFEWAEFIGGRLGDNFADYGAQDIQIADYRVSHP